jgi:hypothetical protein
MTSCWPHAHWVSFSNCSYSSGLMVGIRWTKATTFQISSSLWTLPYDAIALILMPFLMIQNKSALVRPPKSDRSGA